MNALGQVLYDRHMNAADLGRMLEAVAIPNVYAWVNGGQKLPAYRASEISQVLDLGANEIEALSKLVSDSGHKFTAEAPEDETPTTYIGYGFQTVYREDAKEIYAVSLQRFADAVGVVDALTLNDYIEGRRLIALNDVVAIADALTPTRPDWAVGGLSHEVEDDEDNSDDFFRLRTDLSNADSIDDIKDLVAAYIAKPPHARPMEPSRVLEYLGVLESETHPTANALGQEFAAARRIS